MGDKSSAVGHQLARNKEVSAELYKRSLCFSHHTSVSVPLAYNLRQSLYSSRTYNAIFASLNIADVNMIVPSQNGVKSL